MANSASFSLVEDDLRFREQPRLSVYRLEEKIDIEYDLLRFVAAIVLVNAELVLQSRRKKTALLPRPETAPEKTAEENNRGQRRGARPETVFRRGVEKNLQRERYGICPLK